MISTKKSLVCRSSGLTRFFRFQKYIRDYDEALDRLFHAHNMKKAQTRSNALLSAVGRPDGLLNVVHIAGTNGKGSTCHKVAKGLQDMGYKTGLYSSPHILTFRERIRVNGMPISEDKVISLSNEIIEKTGEVSRRMSTSFFEMCTLMAFMHFAESDCDYAVIETGMGGKSDATNVVSQPVVTAITSIGWDHMDVLGRTLTNIAKHKAGILKERVPAFLGPTAVLEPILDRAKQLDAPVFKIPQGSNFEEENTFLSWEILRYLGAAWDVVKDAVNSKPPVRYWCVPADAVGKATEKLCGVGSQNLVKLVLDVGHNENAIEAVLRKARLDFPNHKIRMGIVVSSDRDFSIVAKAIVNSQAQSYIEQVRYLPSEHPRLKDPESAVEEWNTVTDENLRKLFLPPMDLKKSMENLIKPPESQTVTILTGSFFGMQEILEALGMESEFLERELRGLRADNANFS
eukprot:GHVP01014661.1.p2 GENE.GHVP01014661.1~~GHVP01014661.1.p2  ORF type:complete len:459 (-),score=65.74 GHVP01014661.1:4239-5615(-)